MPFSWYYVDEKLSDLDDNWIQELVCFKRTNVLIKRIWILLLSSSKKVLLPRTSKF